MIVAGLAKLQLGADAEAVARLRRSIDINRNHFRAHFYLAAALALLGELDEARAATQAGLALNPDFRSARTPPARTVAEPPWILVSQT
jgi:Flp pilus assembly protein TadD